MRRFFHRLRQRRTRSTLLPSLRLGRGVQLVSHGLASVEPPKLTAVRTDRAFVFQGQTLVVQWTAEHARAIEVTARARTARVNGAAGSGSVPVLLSSSGFVEVRAINEAGIDHRCLGPIAVVPVPTEVPLPVPMPQPEWSEPILIEPPQVRLPQLPIVELPAVSCGPMASIVEPEPGPTPGLAPGLAPLWPTLPSVRCPVDVMSLITDGPQLDMGVGRDSGEV